MSIFRFLKLQPVTADDNDDLNKFDPDETFDLQHDEDPAVILNTLDKELEELKTDPIVYSDDVSNTK